MRILIIEDDPKIQAFISNGLRQEGHTVEATSDGKKGCEMWSSESYHAVVLDLMLPQMSGLDILKHMRTSGDTTPVLVLSAKVAVDDRVSGLKSGADDYMTKPFSFSELSARIHAITRRTPQSGEESQQNTTLNVADISINLLKRTVVRGTKKINLQPREYALLELLMRNPKRALTKLLILESIWDCSVDPQTNVVDVLICRLRNKIDAGFEKKLIKTIRGVGYVFQTES
ncbi:MAG: response regulator transcription factor [Kiritimatiellae bacterium]|nr:response regulator transcription factor [Kiritimatiellia bacterium]